MANVRLLRQSIEDYQKDASVANEGYEAAYGNYATEFAAAQAAEAAAVKGYNDRLAAAEASKTPLAVDIGSGYKIIGTSGDGRVVPVVSDLKNQVGDFVFTRLPDGNLQLYKLVQQDWQNKGYKAVEQPVPALEKLTPTVMPTAPAEPKPVQAPNLTVSNTRELMNPGQNQAQLDMQSAKGILGKSELAGDQQAAMRGSAFADPNDPQGLKERGVLARVMGGQL